MVQGALRFGSYFQACSMIGLAVEWIQEQFQLAAGEDGCLAVLHNRNDMVSSFHRSEWVSSSQGSVISRGITSCAGMTARMVLLSQTKDRLPHRRTQQAVPGSSSGATGDTKGRKPMPEQQSHSQERSSCVLLCAHWT